MSNKFRCFYSLEDHKDELEQINREQPKEKFDLIEEISLTTMKTLQLYFQFKLKIEEKEFDQSKEWYALKNVIAKMACISIINAYWVSVFLVEIEKFCSNVNLKEPF